MSTENSGNCVFCLTVYGDSVLLVTLTAFFLSVTVDIEQGISWLAVSANFSSGTALPVVFQSEGGSSKAVTVFVVLGGIVRMLSVGIGWSFAIVSTEAVLTCIVKCGKCMRPCVVSMTTLFSPIKRKPMIGLSLSLLRRNVQQMCCFQNQKQLCLLLMVSLTGHSQLVFENRKRLWFWGCYSGLLF